MATIHEANTIRHDNERRFDDISGSREKAVRAAADAFGKVLHENVAFETAKAVTDSLGLLITEVFHPSAPPAAKLVEEARELKAAKGKKPKK